MKKSPIYALVALLVLTGVILFGNSNTIFPDKIAEKADSITMNEFFEAIDRNDFEKIKKLALNYPDLVNAIDKQGFSPLHKAAEKGEEEVSEFLIEKGAEVDSVSSGEKRYFADEAGGLTPLLYAAKNGHEDVAALLLAHGADVNALEILSQSCCSGTNYGRSPLDYAIAGDNMDMAELLVTKGADVQHSIYELTRDGKKEQIEWLIARGATLDGNVLRSAVYEGNRSMIELILKKGVDVNSRDDEGYSPLHLAVDREDMETVKFLISKGALVNAKSIEGYTPIYKSYSAAMAKLLISKGARIDERNRDGDTVLHYLAGTWYGYDEDAHDDITGFFISRGLDVNAGNNRGDTPLHLLAKGVSIDAPKEVAYILSKGAEIGARNNAGATPLHYVRGAEVTETLISRGADANAKDNRGNTPLHYAAGDGNGNESLEALLAGGTDINARNNDDETPLHCAVKAGSLYNARTLVLRNAGVNFKNKSGKTPLKIAKERNDREIAELLRSKGARE